MKRPFEYPPTSPELADNRGKRIGILIVAYNAATTLAKVFRRIPEIVWKNVEEVVVFDDASQDETFELALGYLQVNPNTTGVQISWKPVGVELKAKDLRC